ncbi:hypothetical protein J3R30DRAFT_3710695 [Lentinula aciculospora]|uniref:Uncharacterized protein n=1 Tax=Lentinula aciculospora TaxID=153920 RepID=A0A9W9A0Z1_9AGAR|nr:hypothetical protein J3R30DRAFT_3710695 [Lentinula aciculospora]
MLLLPHIFSLLLVDALLSISVSARPLVTQTHHQLGGRETDEVKLKLAVRKPDGTFRVWGKWSNKPLKADDVLVFFFHDIVGFQVDTSYDALGQPQLTVTDVECPRRASNRLDTRLFGKLGMLPVSAKELPSGTELVAAPNSKLDKTSLEERFGNPQKLLQDVKVKLVSRGEDNSVLDEELIVEDAVDYFSLIMISLRYEDGRGPDGRVLPELGNTHPRWPILYRDMKQLQGKKSNEYLMELLQGTHYRP